MVSCGDELMKDREEMKQIFNPCVSRVIALIDGQRQQVERKNNRRVKASRILVWSRSENPTNWTECLSSWRLWGIPISSRRADEVFENEANQNATA